MASFDDTLKPAILQVAATDPIRAYRAAGYSGILKPAGKIFKGLCQFHDDHTPSLDVGRDGKFHCSPCALHGDVFAFAARVHGLQLPAQFREVVVLMARALGMEGKQTVPKARVTYRETARWTVLDLPGERIEHVRRDGSDGSKKFDWWRNGETRKGILEAQGDLPARTPGSLPLWRMADVKAADLSRPVLLCEGQRATDALADRGVLAAGTYGCGADPTTSVLAFLSGRRVILAPDRDTPGRKHMNKIGTLLAAHGCTVLEIEWPGDPGSGADAADFDGTDAELESLIAAATPWTPAAAGTTRRVKITTHAELEAMVFPPMKWAVPGLLPEGLTLLAGRGKIGKSYLSLQIACAVGSGGQVFGKPVEPGKVLYIALEDGMRRRQSRAREQMWPADVDVDWADDLPKYDDGGIDELAELLADGQYRLCVLDTVGRFMGVKDFNDYGPMTTAFGALQELAGRTSTSLLCLAHHNKAAQGDVVTDLLGSTGISGAADTLLGLYQEAPRSTVYHLKTIGRESEESELELKRDDLTRTWLLAASSGGLKPGSVRAQIVDAVRNIGGGVTLTQIAVYLGKEPGAIDRELKAAVESRVLTADTSRRPALYRLTPTDSA